MRRIISSEFTPRMVGRLEQLLADRTARILEAAADRGPCDFVRDIAYQVPMHVIADIIGIPEEDRGWIFERTDHLLRAGNPYGEFSEDERLALQAEVFEYAQRITADKRANPADDVWTKLASRLDGFELEMFFLILSIAGSETTRNALTMGLIALLDHPDQLAGLRADPSLSATAADEILRWSSPVLIFGRTATCDVTLGGQDIKAGDRVVFWHPSGNRDESVFENPFRFDIHRSPTRTSPSAAAACTTASAPISPTKRSGWSSSPSRRATTLSSPDPPRGPAPAPCTTSASGSTRCPCT